MAGWWLCASCWCRNKTQRLSLTHKLLHLAHIQRAPRSSRRHKSKGKSPPSLTLGLEDPTGLLPFLLQRKLACMLPVNSLYQENSASLGGAEWFKKQVRGKEDSRARKWRVPSQADGKCVLLEVKRAGGGLLTPRCCWLQSSSICIFCALVHISIRLAHPLPSPSSQELLVICIRG